MLSLLLILFLQNAHASVVSLDDSILPENETAIHDVDLRSVLRTVLETNAKQEARITSLEAKLDVTTATLADTKEKLAEMTQRLDAVIANPQSTSVVGFTAYNTESKSVGAGTDLVFGGIVSNFGDHYDPATGIFTCPVTGLYLFATSIGLGGEDQMDMSIFVESTALATVYAVDWDQGSVVAITECQQSQRVWVQVAKDGCYFQSGKYTTFSGVLL